MLDYIDDETIMKICTQSGFGSIDTNYIYRSPTPGDSTVYVQRGNDAAYIWSNSDKNFGIEAFKLDSCPQRYQKLGFHLDTNTAQQLKPRSESSIMKCPGYPDDIWISDAWNSILYSLLRESDHLYMVTDASNSDMNSYLKSEFDLED